ncbi:MAG: CAP domain-containing protein [Acidimicrobiales bacterium]
MVTKTVAFVLALVLAPAAAAAPRAARADLRLLASINLVRAGNGLPPLHLSSGLSRAAALHDVQMSQAGYFGHESPGGAPFWSRIMPRYRPASGHRWVVGENIAWNSAAMSATATVALWMGSPEHRANLLDPRWHDVGIAVVRVESAPGVFGAGPATIVTVDFGARS